MNAQQGTPAWFNARAGKLTASRFGAAVGICPFTSRAKAFREVMGIEPWRGDMSACKWGTINEKNALKDYMVRTGNVVKTKGFYGHPDYDWLGGSPDGLVGDEGLIEIKCPFFKQVPHEKIPPHYYCQINGLMEILDKQWCDFVSWTPKEMKIYRVYRDPDLFSFLLDRYTIFYAYMKRGASSMPRMQAGEKAEVLQRISDSDDITDYTFWRYTEPAMLKGVWEAPPPESDDESEDEPSSKRFKNDEPTQVGVVHQQADGTGSDSAASG